MKPNITVINESLKSSLKWEYLESIDHIKSGQYGSVYKYRNSKKPTSFFAVKIVNYNQNDPDRDKIFNEIKLLEDILQIPKIFTYFPEYYGHVRYTQPEPPSQTPKEYHALVFELGSGNLKRFYEDYRPKGLTFKENLILLECFAMGLGTLEEKRIAHRDVKPENIVFFEENGTLLNFKIIDFGEVKLGVGQESTLRGTPTYLSPEENVEYLNGSQMLQENNIYKSDIYSIGLTLLYANLGKHPFPIKNQKTDRKAELLKNPLTVIAGPFDETIRNMIDEIVKRFESEKGVAIFKIILRKCLEYNPMNRFDILALKGALQTLMEIENGSVEGLLNLKEKKEIQELKEKTQNLNDEKNELSNKLEEEKKARENLQRLNEQLKAQIVQLEERKSQQPIAVSDYMKMKPNPSLINDDPEETLTNVKFIKKEKNAWKKIDSFKVIFCFFVQFIYFLSFFFKG